MFTDLKSICVSGWTLIFTLSGWWFGTCFIFPYIGNNNPNWLSYFSEGWFNHQPALNYIKNHHFGWFQSPFPLFKSPGYGSIPIHTIFSGMNIHKSQLFWCELQGYYWSWHTATSLQEVVDYFLRYAEFLLATFPEAAGDRGDIHHDIPPIFRKSTRMVQIINFLMGLFDYWFYNRLTIISTWYDMIYMYIMIYIYIYILSWNSSKLTFVFTHISPTCHIKTQFDVIPELLNWTEHCTAHSYIYIYIIC